MKEKTLIRVISLQRTITNSLTKARLVNKGSTLPEVLLNTIYCRVCHDVQGVQLSITDYTPITVIVKTIFISVSNIQCDVQKYKITRNRGRMKALKECKLID